MAKKKNKKNKKRVSGFVTENRKKKNESAKARTTKEMAEAYLEAEKRQDHEHQLRKHDYKQGLLATENKEKRHLQKEYDKEKFIDRRYNYSDDLETFKEKNAVEKRKLANEKISREEYFAWLQEAKIKYNESQYYHNHYHDDDREASFGKEHINIFFFIVEEMRTQILIKELFGKELSAKSGEYMRILAQLKAGKSQKEIADSMHIDKRTLQRRIAEMKKKSGCEIKDLLSIAGENNII